MFFWANTGGNSISLIFHLRQERQTLIKVIIKKIPALTITDFKEQELAVFAMTMIRCCGLVVDCYSVQSALKARDYVFVLLFIVLLRWWNYGSVPEEGEINGYVQMYSEISCLVKVVYLFAHIFGLLAKHNFTSQVLIFAQCNFKKTVIHKELPKQDDCKADLIARIYCS